MNKEELINNVAELKEQLRSLVDTAESEKRALTDEEKTQFEETQRQINDLKTQIENTEVNPSTENKINTNKMDSKNYLRNLAQQVSDIVNNRSLEGYTNISGNTIELRQDAYSTVPDVDDIQALEYTRILEPLQNAVIFDKLGLTFINTGSLVKLPSVTAVECSINGETTQLESQKVEFSNKSIVPVRLGAAVGLSNTSIKTVENNVNLLAYALRALRQAEERLINKMLFAPVAVAGSDASVKGLFVDMLADASAGKATWANILGLQTAVKNKNGVITENAVYIMSPDTADKLRSMPTALKTPTYGSRFVLEDGKIGGCVVFETNEVNHYDASNNVDYSYIGFIADPSTIIVQEVSSPDLVVDPYTRAKWNETELVLNDNIGFMHERDALLSCMKIDSSSWTA
jgi:HK97 family phage major capsid protein